MNESDSMIELVIVQAELIRELTRERDEARAVIGAVLAACPVNMVEFDGDVPNYVRACFDEKN